MHGLGSGAIDAGLNHYVAHHFSPRHMNWLHAFYSLGATLGALVMTAAISSPRSWRAGYFTVATILLLLALVFAVTKSRWDQPGSNGGGGGEIRSAGFIAQRAGVESITLAAVVMAFCLLSLHEILLYRDAKA